VRGTKTEVRPGVWRLRVVTGYSPEGRPRQASRTYTGTKKDADTALAGFVTAIESGTASLDGTTSLDAFLDRWIEHIESQRSPTTVRGYKDKLRRVRRDLGSIKIGKLTAQRLDRAYQQWLAEGITASTVHGIHSVLSAALHQAEKWGIVPRAATEKATPPQKRTPPVQELDPATVVAIVNACRESEPVLAAAIVLAATTGLRRGELCGLRWPDLDLEAAAIRIRRAVKYGPDRRPIVGPTKTHQERRVALDAGTVAVLSEHRERAQGCAAAAEVELDPEGYVFTLNPTGKTPWLPDSYSHAFARMARKTGARVRLHDLRHFSATHAIAAGIDVRTVAGRLGHADPAVTLKVYSSFVAERDRHAADVLGALLDGI
jgi:integrase